MIEQELKGFIRDMGNEAYHADKTHISSSVIPVLLQGPAYFQVYQPTTTPAMVLGTYVHSAILEPESFDIDDVIPVDGRLKPGGDAFNRAKEQWQGQVMAMAQAVLGCPEATSLLQDTSRELSLFRSWEGVKCKCRCDAYRADRPTIVDLKTTSAETIDECIDSIVRFHYDIKQAFYRALVSEEVMGGFDYPDYYWIFVGKQEPYPVWVLQPCDEMLDRGILKCKEALRTYRECESKKHWPKPSAGPFVVKYPKWAKR